MTAMGISISSGIGKAKEFMPRTLIQDFQLGKPSLQFPKGMVSNRRLTIGVYDTDIKTDKIYGGIIGGVASLAGTAQAAFSDASANSEGKGTAGIAGESLIGGAKLAYESVTTAASGAWSAAGNILKAGSDALGTGTAANGALTKSWKANFYLPLPNAISENLSHEFAEENGWLQDIMVAGPLAAGTIKATLELHAPLAKMTGSQSVVFDENKLMMYKGSAFREISLSWDLVPNNAQENEDIHEIVRQIKMYSSPQSQAGKLLLKSPHFFSLTFGNRILDKALQFQEVVLLDVSVEYAPGGAMNMFGDGAPKTVNLSMKFKDREPKLYEHWESEKMTGLFKDGQNKSC